jgi:hypothetical protein
MESDNVNDIKEAKSKLEQASHKFAERIYRESGAQAAQEEEPMGDESGPPPGEEGGEKVYDADYEVVDDDKK